MNNCIKHFIGGFELSLTAIFLGTLTKQTTSTIISNICPTCGKQLTNTSAGNTCHWCNAKKILKEIGWDNDKKPPTTQSTTKYSIKENHYENQERV